jgi:hypothetical protein
VARSQESVVDALAAGARRYVVFFEDVLVAVPSEQRRFLATWLQNRATAARSRSGGRLATLWRNLTS